jgi:hypothetical protein
VPSKRIPKRQSKIAEDYARKVRLEPAKASRQETRTLDTSKFRGIPGQHDHGPAQQPKNKKFPEGRRAS